MRRQKHIANNLSLFRPYARFMPVGLKRSMKRVYQLITGNDGYTFSGWGMKTSRSVPWDNGIGNDFFLKASKDVKLNFDFSGDGGVLLSNVDSLLWRHWTISNAVRYVIEFSKKSDLNLVECGVCDGLTAFFTLSELEGRKKRGLLDNYHLHLYDAWMPMRRDDLSSSENNVAGNYENIDIDRVKKNLSKFKGGVIYHQGYIPESLSASPSASKSIVYLHIDLNSAKATLDVLNFFYPRVVRGGIILFDDYGSVLYRDTKKVVDKFFDGKPGILMPLPTGQAIFYR